MKAILAKQTVIIWILTALTIILMSTVIILGVRSTDRLILVDGEYYEVRGDIYFGSATLIFNTPDGDHMVLSYYEYEVIR